MSEHNEAVDRVKSGNFNSGYGFDLGLLINAVGELGEMLRDGRLVEAKAIAPVRPTYRQGKAYCGACGKRIPLKIKANFCHKCGRQILWIPTTTEAETE